MTETATSNADGWSDVVVTGEIYTPPGTWNEYGDLRVEMTGGVTWSTDTWSFTTEGGWHTLYSTTVRVKHAADGGGSITVTFRLADDSGTSGLEGPAEVSGTLTLTQTMPAGPSVPRGTRGATVLRAYNAQKVALGLLPDFANLSEQVQLNDTGLLKFSYLPTGVNAAFLSEEILYFRLVEGGVESDQVYVYDDEADNLAATGAGAMVQVNARGALAILEQAEVYPGKHVAGKSVDGLEAFHEFKNATPGAIFTELIRRAKDRGALTAVEANFSATVDSAGVPWPTAYSVTYNAGMSYLELLRAASNNGWIDMEMNGFELRLYVPNTTLNQNRPNVVFRTGQQVSSAPRKRTRRGIITHMLGVGAEKNLVEVADPNAAAVYGRREGHAADGRMTENGSLLSMTQSELNRTKQVREGFTLALATVPPRGETWPIAHSDYRVGDRVYWDAMPLSDTQLEPLRVRSITRTWKSTVTPASVEVELNDQFVERSLKLERQMQGIVQGSVTAAPPPTTTPAKDVTTPRPPASLGAEPTVYAVGSGHRATVMVQWTPTTENVDGSEYNDHDTYLVSWSDDGKTWSGATLVQEPYIWLSDLTPGARLWVRVRTRDSSGNESSWATYYVGELPVDDVPPPKPSPPVVKTVLGVSTIGWNGKAADGGKMPPDFSAVVCYQAGTEASTNVEAYRGRWVQRVIKLTADRGDVGGALHLYGVRIAANTPARTLLSSPAGAPWGPVTASLASTASTRTLTIRSGDEQSVVDLATAGIAPFGQDFDLHLTAHRGTLEAKVNGTVVASQPIPAGATILSTDPTSATGITAVEASVDELAYYPPGTPEVVGTIPQSDAQTKLFIAGQEYDRPYTVWFVAEDSGGNESDPSDSVTFHSERLVDADLIATTIAQGVAEAKQNAAAALTSVDGKTTNYYQTPAPTGGDYIVGDTWYDIDDDNKPYRWSGTEWVEVAFGPGALAAEVTQQIADAAQAASDAQVAAQRAQAAADASSSSAANQVINGSFEDSSGVGWTLPMQGEIVEVPDAAQGSNVLRVTTTGGTLSVLPEASNYVPTEPGRVWRISTRVRKTTASTVGTVNVAVAKQMGSGGLQYKPITSVAVSVLTTDWTTLTGYYTVEEQVEAVTVFPGGLETVPAGAVLEWDSFSLQDVTEAREAVTLAEAASAAAAAAATTAGNALTAANGKNRTWSQPTAPAGTGHTVADTWFDTDDGNKPYRWSGSAWVAAQFGSNAIANLSITNAQIADGTIQAAKIGSLDAGVITAGSITGTKIAARTLTAEKMVIGSADNLIPNGTGEFGGLGGVWAAPITWSTDAPLGSGLPGSFVSTAGQGTWTPPSHLIDVEPGGEYLFEAWVKADKAGSMLFVELRDQTGEHAATCKAVPGEPSAASGAYPIGSYTVPTTWTLVTAAVTVNESTNKMRLGGIYFNHPNGSVADATVTIAGVRLRRRNAGRLIVDGTIAASKLDVEDVQAQIVKTTLLDASKITSGYIDAARIKAKSITASKLVITGNNLIPDPEFDSDAWSLPTGGSIGGLGTGDGDLGKSYFLPAGTTQRGGYLNGGSFTVDNVRAWGIPVKAGATLRASYSVRVAAATTDTTAVAMYVRFYSRDGSTYTNTNVGNDISLVADKWTRITGTLKAPTAESEYLAIVGLYAQADYVDAVRFSQPALIAMADSGLIVDGAITAEKVAASAITADSIAANAVTTDKINAGAITAVKIAATAITADKIAAGAITADKIAANTITADKIAANAITASELSATAIDGKTITGATIRTAASGDRLQLSGNTLTAYTGTTATAQILPSGVKLYYGGAFRHYYSDGTTIGASLGAWGTGAWGFIFQDSASKGVLRAYTEVNSSGTSTNNRVYVGVETKLVSTSITYATTSSWYPVVNNASQRVSITTPVNNNQSPRLRLYSGTGFEAVLKYVDNTTTEELQVRGQNDGYYMPVKAATFTATSDERLKTNIVDADLGNDALSLVRGTPVRAYQRIDVRPPAAPPSSPEEDEDTPDMGEAGLFHLIAQPAPPPDPDRLGPVEIGLVAQEAPEAITVGDPLVEDMSVDVYKMSTLLWKAVQELADKVDALAADNAPR